MYITGSLRKMNRSFDTKNKFVAADKSLNLFRCFAFAHGDIFVRKNSRAHGSIKNFVLYICTNSAFFPRENLVLLIGKVN